MPVPPSEYEMAELTRREFLKTTGAATVALGAFSVMPRPGCTATAKGGRRPNILFFYPDQHRPDWVGEGSDVPVRTPNLDWLVGRGARFSNALTPSPVCAPARACLASGKEYDRCRVPSNGFNYPLDQTTVYTLIRDNGYRVMGCGKFDLHKKSESWGIDGKHHLMEWGFSDGIDNAGKWDAVRSGRKKPKDPYMQYLEVHGQRLVHIQDMEKRRVKNAAHATPLTEDAYCDNWIAENGLQLLKKARRNEPWFLQVNFTGPHDPWDVTERMKRLGLTIEGLPQPNRNTQFTPEQHIAVRQNYTAMVENIDRWLGIYIEELRKRRELDNTLIVFSSDHGEMLGDHDRWGKSVPYQAAAGVPLVVAGPRVKAGLVNDAPMTTLDLPATFLDCAGVETPKDMDSRSLMPILEGESKDHREYALSGLQRWRSVFDGRYKLVRGFETRKKKDAKGEPAQLLFDLKADPFENENIADANTDIVARLSKILDKETIIVTGRKQAGEPKRTAGAIITRKQGGELQVLLTRRNVNPYKGKWCFPGGHVDPGETAAQTVVREVKEETGLDFKGVLFRGFEEDIPEMRVNNIVSMFEGSVTGELKFDPGEVAEAKWFPLDEALQLEMAFYHHDVLTEWNSVQS